jgi:hypothetical protein
MVRKFNAGLIAKSNKLDFKSTSSDMFGFSGVNTPGISGVLDQNAENLDYVIPCVP